LRHHDRHDGCRLRLLPLHEQYAGLLQRLKLQFGSRTKIRYGPNG
jgi:hypothetical protein